MGSDGAGAEARLDFAVSDVNGQNTRALLEELNETLIGILGHNGTMHVCMDDDWTFVKIYTDEGITGTSTRHREGFNEMINDAFRAG